MGYKKNLMSKELGDPNLVNITTPIFNFYTRSGFPKTCWFYWRG